MIEPTHPEITISQQCELLGISRSGIMWIVNGFADYTSSWD